MVPSYKIEKSADLVPRLDVPKYLSLKAQGGRPDLFNSIRAAMLCHVQCFGFSNMIDPADFPFIKSVLNIDLSHEHYTTLANTTRYHSPVISQRFGRIPIYTSPVTRGVLTTSDVVMIIFMICDRDDPTKPLKNMNPVDLIVTSRSLVPFAYTKVDSVWQLDQGRTDSIRSLIDTIFYYDTMICTLAYGQELHVIVKPLYDIGFKDPRWQPCTFSFRHSRDPAWSQEPDYANVQIRKKPGMMSLREQFHTMPPTVCREKGLPEGTKYDKLFSIPYEVEVMFFFNGKMDPLLAFLNSIDVLKDALEKLYTQYQTATTTLTDVDAVTSIVHKVNSDTTQTIYVPFNTNDVIPDQYTILTQHAIGNLVANKMLYLFDTHIVKGNVELYEGALIAYKNPHHLIQQCTYTIQLPLDRDLCLQRFADIGITNEFHENLVKKAITELVQDLDRVRAVF